MLLFTLNCSADFHSRTCSYKHNAITQYKKSKFRNIKYDILENQELKKPNTLATIKGSTLKIKALEVSLGIQILWLHLPYTVLLIFIKFPLSWLRLILFDDLMLPSDVDIFGMDPTRVNFLGMLILSSLILWPNLQ